LLIIRICEREKRGAFDCMIELLLKSAYQGMISSA
jgi:hypothetical protein